MIDTAALKSCLHSIGLSNWSDTFEPLIKERMSASGHGDYARWENILRSLHEESGDIRPLLLGLSPWRKGPFNVAGVEIDSEWRSDLKWARLKDKIAPLDGRSVLDVGSGNGFYALQMRKAGAKAVIGVDPTLLFVMQFLAINHFEQVPNVFVAPARLHELPLPSPVFDTVFSMGVLYHQREPTDHLYQLRQTLRRGGQLVLETIYLPGDETVATTPEGRYARMRNVWLLPTIPKLTAWLTECGYRDIEIVDQSLTTVDEQRATDWMTFDSLREALDPNDATRTIEGMPAPHRLVVTALAP